MNSSKTFPNILLVTKLVFCLSFFTPKCNLYYCSVYSSLVLFLIGDERQIFHLIAFVALYVIHIALTILYLACEKTAGKVFASLVVVMLIVDILGYIIYYGAPFIWLGIVFDVVCIVFVVKSIFLKL